MPLHTELAGNTVRLSGEATLYDGKALKAALEPLLANPEQVSVNLGGLQEIDLAGIQILLSFVTTRGDAPTRLVAAGEPTRRRFQTCGLGEWLEPATADSAGTANGQGE